MQKKKEQENLPKVSEYFEYRSQKSFSNEENFRVKKKRRK